MTLRKYLFGLVLGLAVIGLTAAPVSFNIATFSIEISNAWAGGHKDKKAKKAKKNKKPKKEKSCSKDKPCNDENEKGKSEGKGKGKGKK